MQNTLQSAGPREVSNQRLRLAPETQPLHNLPLSSPMPLRHGRQHSWMTFGYSLPVQTSKWETVGNMMPTLVVTSGWKNTTSQAFVQHGSAAVLERHEPRRGKGIPNGMYLRGGRWCFTQARAAPYCPPSTSPYHRLEQMEDFPYLPSRDGGIAGEFPTPFSRLFQITERKKQILMWPTIWSELNFTAVSKHYTTSICAVLLCCFVLFFKLKHSGISCWLLTNSFPQRIWFSHLKPVFHPMLYLVTNQ